MLRPYKELPRQVHILCLGTFINRAGTLLLPFLTLYLTRELGFGAKFAGLGMGAIGAGSIIGALVGGAMADRFGRRGVMLASLLGCAAVLSFFGYVTSPYAIIATLVLFASLADMYRPAAAAMIGDLVPAEQRPYAFGLMYFAINLGFPFGTVFGGMLAAHWFRGLFWIDAFTAVMYAAIIFIYTRETLPSRKQADADSRDAEPARPNVEVETGSTDGRTIARHVLSDRPFIIFCLGSLLLGLIYVQSFSTLPMFMRSHGLDVEVFGRLIAINGVMIVLIQIPLTAWMKRYNRATFVYLSAAITGLGFGATAFCTTTGMFAITIMIWTMGEIMFAPFSHAIVTDMAPVAYRARYMGVFTMCFASANMLGAPLGSLVLGLGGGAVLWGGTLLLGLLSAGLYASIHRHVSTKREVSAS